MSSPDSSETYTPDDDEPLSAAILTALSNAKGRDVMEDDRVLYDSIDVSVLEKLFREGRDGDTIKVEFTTHDAIVILRGNGSKQIEVQDLEVHSTNEGDPNGESV